MYRFTWTAATAAAFALLSAAPATADTTTQTLSVVGNGRVFVTPDVADATVTVTRTAGTSRAALSAANRSSDAIVNGVEALGIPPADIQTQNVNVSSFKNKHHRRRWSAQESIGIHITNVKLVGPVIDTSTHDGASDVGGPSFSFSNPSAGTAAAEQAAIADAQAQANSAAAAVGYKVTGVQSIDLNPQSGPVVTAGASAPVKAKAPSTPTSINPGTQEVDAQVAIVFTIAPA